MYSVARPLILTFIFSTYPTLIWLSAYRRFSRAVRSVVAFLDSFLRACHRLIPAIHFSHAIRSGPHSGPRSRAHSSKSSVLCSPHCSGMSVPHSGDALLGTTVPCRASTPDERRLRISHAPIGTPSLKAPAKSRARTHLTHSHTPHGVHARTLTFLSSCTAFQLFSYTAT